MLNLVLFEPEIPWNTGNIGRTCLALGAQLHLVGRLGFHLDGKEVQRAGLDYWEHVNPIRHTTWEAFEASRPSSAQMFLFSTKGTQLLWRASFNDGDYLVFGRETAGFPTDFYDRYAGSLVCIPQGKGPVRSLNLSTAAGIVLYEATRQIQGRTNS